MAISEKFNFDLKQLRSFIEIVNENSFTKASRKLRIGQATISHHIQSLETVLGVKLFIRTSKEFSLTEEGELFKLFCEKIFIDISDLTKAFSYGDFKLDTKIAASTIPSTYIIPAVISEIKKDFPDYYFKVEISDSRESIELLKDKKADLAIVGKKIKHPSLKYKYIYDDELVLIGDENCKPFKDISHIKNIPFIKRENGSGTKDAYEKSLKKHNIIPSDLNVVYECSTSESVKEAVISGVGMAFISRLAIERELKLGELTIIDIIDFEIKRDFYIVYSNEERLSRPATLFIEYLTKRYSK